MLKSFAKLSIGIKFALIASLLVLVSFGVLTLLMSMTMTRYLDREALDDLAASNRQVADLIQIFNGAAQEDIARIAKHFASSFPGHFDIERGKSTRIGNAEVPLLRAGSENI